MAVAVFCVLFGLTGPGQCFKEQTRGDNLITIGKDLEVEEGTTAEVAIALGGNVIVQGRVHRSVVAVAGAVYLGHASLVEGDIVCIGGPVVQEEGARVRGEITVEDTESMGSLVNRLRDIRIPGVEVRTAFSQPWNGLPLWASFSSPWPRPPSCLLPSGRCPLRWSTTRCARWPWGSSGPSWRCR